MAKKRPPSKQATLRARAHALAQSGHAHRNIAEMLTKEGNRVSKSTVARWLATPAAPRAPRPAGQNTGRDPSGADTGASGTDTGASEEAPSGTTEELLANAVRDLRDLCAIAKASGALPAFASLQRVTNQTLALAERLRPPPAPDPDADPDVQAAAAACRAKLHQLLDAALGGRS